MRDKPVATRLRVHIWISLGRGWNTCRIIYCPSFQHFASVDLSAEAFFFDKTLGFA